MTTIWLIALSGLTAVYAAALAYLKRGLRGLGENQAQAKKLPTVTVIVSARNEALHIGRLFECLKAQDYPPELLEFCIVDDRSEDSTFARIEAFARECPRVIPLRIHDTVPHLAPKKRAIDLAIRRSRGEVLLLTDADAQPGPQWVRRIAGLFGDDVAMVCAYAAYRPRATRLQRLLALDFFSLAAVGAAGIGAGRALTCAGSNLAYRRKTYYAVGGFEKIAAVVSGDDDLFLHEVQRQRVGRILYLPDPAATVDTSPPETLRQFFWQRVRFASKGRYYARSFTAGLVAVYGLNLLLGGGSMLSLLLGDWMWLMVIGVLWIVKASAEYAFLSEAAEIFGETALLKFFLPAAVLHPFYVIIFAALGQFLTFRWKGERFVRRLSSQKVADVAP